MRILTLCTVLSFLRIFAAGFSTRRVDFQHPAVQELLRNFSSDGSVYAGAPWPAVQLPVEAPIFAAAEVVKQEQGLRCAIVADMNKAEIGIRDEAGSFQLPSVVQPGSRESRCCRVPALAAAANKAPDPDAFGLHCMPSFVVAGAQKSGTTFLAAALAQHPQISFSLRKELHYFNNEAHYSKGLREGYLRSFPAWNYTDPLWKYGPPIYGEATPAYIAHRSACPRISLALGPRARVVLLLREPVARLYSEYQMKARRVRQQDSFIALAHTYAAELHACLDPDNNGEGASQHGYSSPTLERVSSWAIIKRCVPRDLSEHAHWPKLVQAIDMQVKVDNKSWNRVLGECFDFRDAEERTAGDSQNCEGDTTASRPTVRFRALPCLHKYGKEKLKPEEDSFFGEISNFRSCAANITDVDTSLVKLDKAVQRCVRVQKGISGQYVYRSTYVAQLFRCFQSLPMHRVLVLPAERLRTAPRETLARVLTFIGASVRDLAAVNFTDTGIRTSVKSRFAHFETSTGWQLTGEYQPMDTSLQARLREYFAPLNQRLFDYLGETFTEWGY